jgi:outer membrane protein, heavy metal efflux system
MLRRFTIFLLFGTFFYKGGAQTGDTLQLTLKQVDSIFFKTSFTLLAAQYNIEANKALEIQARLYPNPTFTADFNAYDPQNNREFHIGPTGQKAFGIEQLILLGGKRSAAIQYAKQNTQLAAYEFEEIVNTLKLQLHISFYSLQQQTFVLEKYTQQLTLLDTLIIAYEEQAAKGNITLKDVVRLKSAYLKINNDRAELAKQHTEETKKIQVLLQKSGYVVPVLAEGHYAGFEKQPELANILALALANRPEIKIANTQAMLAATQLRYQKAQAVPDVSLFTAYDQRGGAFNNQINVGFSIPLPVFNRNQGNIKAAAWQQKTMQTLEQQKMVEISAEVNEAYTNMLRSMQEYRKAKRLYNDDFETVAKGVMDNFQKRNLSIIEFVDFFEAYNESVAERQRINIQLATGAELINYVTASQIYNYE